MCGERNLLESSANRMSPFDIIYVFDQWDIDVAFKDGFEGFIVYVRVFMVSSIVRIFYLTRVLCGCNQELKENIVCGIYVFI